MEIFFLYELRVLNIYYAKMHFKYLGLVIGLMWLCQEDEYYML